MVAFWYLLILAPFIVIPILWWNFRRKQAQKEELAGMRWERLVITARVDDAPAAAATAATPEYRRRERLLDAGQTLVYLLLKQGSLTTRFWPTWRWPTCSSCRPPAAMPDRGSRSDC
jgi:hypothetical protein